MTRSDNYPYTGRITYLCSGSGSVNIITGFPVVSAIVTFATLPLKSDVPSVHSSSSTSSLDSSSESSGSSYTSFPTEDLPRIYVSGYLATGFVVSYDGISEDVGYIEFTYSAS